MKNPVKINWLLFALVTVAIYFFALDLPLLGPDESRYSQVAREMFERGDWVTTTLGGYNWFEKPALLYWLQISFFNLFGVSEFSARFGSALFGLGTALSLFILGRSYIASRQYLLNKAAADEPLSAIPNPELPYWLALITASSLGMLVFSRGASFDIILTFPIAASLVSFFIFENSERIYSKKNYLPLISFYLFIGVALIAKGLVGIVFPFAIVGFYYLLRLKFPSKTVIISLLWGTLISIAVASVWYLPMYLKNGWEFIDEFFIQHHFARYSSNKYLHPQPFWFFWLVLPAMTIPWFPFFIASIWKLAKSVFSRKDANAQGPEKPETKFANRELRLFALAWILVPLVFFSLSGSKLPGYILPSLPAACILTAEFVSRFVNKNAVRKLALQILAFLMFSAVAFLLAVELPKFAKDDSVKDLIGSAVNRGYTSEKILSMQTVSHNAEFYGAGRLVRLRDGKQRRFDAGDEILHFMTEEKIDTVLVLLPPQFVEELGQSPRLRLEKIDENKNLVILRLRRN
ncbi:MAG: glycosyltransferase family 39 protein [Pyrinomonadaceae bacterium]